MQKVHKVIQREVRNDLRMDLKVKIRAWGLVDEDDDAPPSPTKAGQFLAEALGFHRFVELARIHDRDDDLHNKLLALNGPNGYALLKAMLILNEDRK